MEAIRFQKEAGECVARIRGYLIPDMTRIEDAALVAHTIGQREIEMLYGPTTRMGWFTRSVRLSISFVSGKGLRVKYLSHKKDESGIL